MYSGNFRKKEVIKVIKTVNERHYPKKTKRLPRPLSADVEKRIFFQLPDNWFGVVHRLALVTGLRVHEMLNCRRGLIDLCYCQAKSAIYGHQKYPPLKHP